MKPETEPGVTILFTVSSLFSRRAFLTTGVVKLLLETGGRARFFAALCVSFMALAVAGSFRFAFFTGAFGLSIDTEALANDERAVGLGATLRATGL